MRLLLVGAGASFSTKDVEQGYLSALRTAGIETHLYLLDRRIEIAFKWVKFMWKHLHGSDPKVAPNWEDAVYRAGIEALEMALRYDVDWVVVVSAMYFHPNVIEMMRRAGLKICVIFTESPYEDEKQKRVAGMVQLCSTNERTSVKVLGPNCFYLSHAFGRQIVCDGGILRKNELSEPVALQQVVAQQQVVPAEEEVLSHDVVFVGSGFPERLELFQAIDWKGLGIDLGLYGTWTLLSTKDKLRKFIKGGIVPNWKTQLLYRQAKIGLNLHRSSVGYFKNADRISYAESLNPRGFELAANGTFCITDYRQEGAEIFGPTQPIFRNPKELEHQLVYYLGNEGDRLALAQMAQERAKDHTYETRVQTLLERLTSYGN